MDGEVQNGTTSWAEAAEASAEASFAPKTERRKVRREDEKPPKRARRGRKAPTADVEG